VRSVGSLGLTIRVSADDDYSSSILFSLIEIAIPNSIP
jgi:hypothetical protein